MYNFKQSVSPTNIGVERDYLCLGAKLSHDPEITGKASPGHKWVDENETKDELTKKGAEGPFVRPKSIHILYVKQTVPLNRYEPDRTHHCLMLL